MKIGLVSTCALATPPKAYGGTELVVAELAHGIAELGHELTVYATGDSKPHGTLRWCVETPIFPRDSHAAEAHARFAFDDMSKAGVDVVHFHDEACLAHLGRVRVPSVLTLHHHRDQRLLSSYLAHPSVHYVAISHDQARLTPELSFSRVIHHGLDPQKYAFGHGNGGYAAFLGRLAPEKGPHIAIDAAVRAGVPLRLGGAPHAVAKRYFAEDVVPRLLRYGGHATWLGELEHEAKVELLRGARALLMPIEWDEPFGLVMIEAMFVGTPVIAFTRGSTREVIDEGVTGFLVRDAEEMSRRLSDVDAIDRARCRARAVERFSYLRMAREYLDLYQSLTSRRSRASRTSVLGERHV